MRIAANPRARQLRETARPYALNKMECEMVYEAIIHVVMAKESEPVMLPGPIIIPADALPNDRDFLAAVTYCQLADVFVRPQQQGNVPKWGGGTQRGQKRKRSDM